MDSNVTFVGPPTVQDRVHRIMMIDPHIGETLTGSFEGTSDPGYLGNSPYPSSVMYMFTVIFLVKFDPVRLLVAT